LVQAIRNRDPGLARKLRSGVRFHDGSEFTAEDVRFTLERVLRLTNNPNPCTSNIRSIARVEVVDSYTVRFHSLVRDPLLHAPLASFYIVSHRAAADAEPQDFRSGRATIGTGPYRFVSYTPDAELVLRRNDDHWDEKPFWERVVFRIISGDAPRVAARSSRTGRRSIRASAISLTASNPIADDLQGAPRALRALPRAGGPRGQPGRRHHRQPERQERRKRGASIDRPGFDGGKKIKRKSGTSSSIRKAC